MSADLIAMILTGVVSGIFMFLPWIPGLRDIAKLTRVYRLMWSDYYTAVERRHRAGSTATAGSGTAAGPGRGRTP